MYIYCVWGVNIDINQRGWGEGLLGERDREIERERVRHTETERE